MFQTRGSSWSYPMHDDERHAILACQLAAISCTALGVALSSKEAVSSVVLHTQSLSLWAGGGLACVLALGMMAYARQGATTMLILFCAGITAALGVLAAVGAAHAVCDPLVRVVMPRTQTQNLLPRSSIAAQARKLAIETVPGGSEFGCDVASRFAGVGRNAILIFSAVSFGVFFLLAAAIRVVKKERGTMMLYAFFHVGLFSLIATNEDPPWDWRQIYALLAAFAMNAYLVIGLGRNETQPLQQAVVRVWIQLPLLLRDVAVELAASS